MMEVVLFSIPEALAITLLACTLVSTRIKWINVLLIGIGLGIISSVLRPLLGNYLFSIVSYVIILILLLWLTRTSPLWESIVSVFLAAPIYLLIEFINIAILVDLAKINPDNFTDNLGLKFLCFSPQLVITILIILVLSKTKVTLFWDEDQEV